MSFSSEGGGEYVTLFHDHTTYKKLGHKCIQSQYQLMQVPGKRLVVGYTSITRLGNKATYIIIHWRLYLEQTNKGSVQVPLPCVEDLGGAAYS